MSKSFIQLFVSVLIGLGVAVGFNPRVRGELNQTLHETKAVLSEKVNGSNGSVKTVGVAKTQKTQVNTSVSVAAQTHAKASTKVSLKADTKVNSGLGDKVVSGDALLDNSAAKTSLDASLKVDSQIKTKINTQNIDLGQDIKDKAISTLDLGLDLGK